MVLKSVVLIFLCSVVGLSAQAEVNRKCGQPFRQLSITTAHALAGMICSLHANNRTEKSVRLKSQGMNFAHRWTVNIGADEFLIDGVCSTSLGYFDESQERPIVTHPGFKVSLKIPRYEDRCNFAIDGTVTEVYEPKVTNGISEKTAEFLRASVVRANVRKLHLEFSDVGHRSTTTGEFSGGRFLRSIQLGQTITSMLRSGFTGGSINQGAESVENKLGIGDLATLSQAQFFFNEKSEMYTPDFTSIRSTFQFNKSAEISIASRDAMVLSGPTRRELYVRQNGMTQMTDDPKLNYDYEGGTSAFYVSGYDVSTQSTTVVGCTDYNYSGDFNLAQSMTVSDCRRQLQSIPGLNLN